MTDRLAEINRRTWEQASETRIKSGTGPMGKFPDFGGYTTWKMESVNCAGNGGTNRGNGENNNNDNSNVYVLFRSLCFLFQRSFGVF